MTTADKRARKKQNHKNGEKALAAKEARAKAHSARIAEALGRKAAEEAEVDDFFGGPLPKPETEKEAEAQADVFLEMIGENDGVE